MTPVDYRTKVFGRGKLHPDRRGMESLKIRRAIEGIGETEGAVLDVGCGAGMFTGFLAAAMPGRPVVGIDVSLNSLRIARNEHRGINVVVADAGRLPFRSGAVGVIVVFDLLEHLDDVSGCLAEFARVLGRGGVLHVHVPCEGEAGTLWHWLRRFPVLGSLKREMGGHIQRFAYDDILTALRSDGFEVTRIRYSYHIVGQAMDFLSYYTRRVFGEMPRQAAPGGVARKILHYAGQGHEFFRVGAIQALTLFLRLMDRMSAAESAVLGRRPGSMAIDVTVRKPV